jgi:hypothetical protein
LDLKDSEKDDLKRLGQRIEKQEATFRDLITEEELHALFGRIERLISSGTFPEPSDEWPSVPWPPF